MNKTLVTSVGERTNDHEGGRSFYPHRSPAMAASFEKQIVIDGRGHMLGRLASIVAKQVLTGQKVVVVRFESINISGSFYRNKRTSFILQFRYFSFSNRLTKPSVPLSNAIFSAQSSTRSSSASVATSTPRTDPSTSVRHLVSSGASFVG